MLIAVDKPLELSSFDIVKRMKHVFPGQKIGHSGTLDPKATGLMILGIGKGTKRLTSLIGLDKVYETVIDFSKMSDTWDMGYREKYEEFPVESLDAPSLVQVEEKLQQLMPTYELPLPAFSAKKKEGKRMYELARKGKELSESRVMKIHQIDILEYAFPELRLRIGVGSGTYIRSIGYWLGQQF
ncbi:MAG: tRNA pseudouridine(55) synthase [Candidatus Peribacteria bacterium]|jgi:tRNA pseudouridine55 synthase|nr:tRNA pseudouridine(55) synthase [Candidatus Peribacteria bacterium]